MASSMATPSHIHCYNLKSHNKRLNAYSFSSRNIIHVQQEQQPQPQKKITEHSNRSGPEPNYLGVQKNPPSLALCPATKNCVSTSENTSDLTHYAPPWNYNPEEGRGSKNPVSREMAMQELLEVIKSTKPDNFTPKIVEKKDDYVRVEYESPILGFVDDVEFWFPPGKKSLVQYRSASRLGNFDFDMNRKRIKALRMKLEKKGWASEDTA